MLYFSNIIEATYIVQTYTKLYTLNCNLDKLVNMKTLDINTQYIDSAMFTGRAPNDNTSY